MSLLSTSQRISAVFVAVTVLTGCPRVLYLDYHPSASITGSGPVRVDTFAYAGHPTGLMKQKEVESGEHDPERLFLSQDIGEFFATALRKELTSAGYEARPDSIPSRLGNHRTVLPRLCRRSGPAVSNTDPLPGVARGRSAVHDILSIGAATSQRLDEKRFTHRTRRPRLYRSVRQRGASRRSAVVSTNEGFFPRGYHARI